MADLLFGLPWVRQRRAQIYRYNDSILIYSNQKLHTRYRFGRASVEYNTSLIEADLQRKTNWYYALKPIDHLLIKQYNFGWLTAGCRRYNWSISLAVHNADAMVENNHSAYSREIAFWDTNCRLARQYTL